MPTQSEIQSPTPFDASPRIEARDKIQDLNRYREGVETLMRLGSSKPVSNGVPEHAAILFEIFFKYSKKQVRIFCEKLNAVVFDTPELIDAARQAIIAGRRISVMVQKTPEESGFLSMLREYPDKAEILMAPKEIRDKPFNFAVMDVLAVRVEKNRDRTEATASMNIPDVARSWADYFDAQALKSASVLL